MKSFSAHSYLAVGGLRSKIGFKKHCNLKNGFWLLTILDVSNRITFLAKSWHSVNKNPPSINCPICDARGSKEPPKPTSGARNKGAVAPRSFSKI